ncbi:MAG: hypothetical protein Q7S74_01715 [Nanoarchaeota archaeon]|nr:hypothetical protein [Nanoarchaeota archaeon]
MKNKKNAKRFLDVRESTKNKEDSRHKMFGLKVNILLTIIIVFLIISLVYASTFIDNSQSNFNSGTYNFTFYNASGFVQLNSSRLNGTYTSQIFGNGGLARWNNISWIQGGYYQQELPNNQAVETGLGGANMTGNVLLMHLNNDSSVGENATKVYDYSGNENNGTVVGGAVWNSSGKLNGAMSFDGVEDYISGLAAGGAITYSGGYTIHTFTSNGTFNVSKNMNVEVLVVAGGGGGGGGGGGAGGLIYNTSYTINSGNTNVVVGSGGARSTNMGNPGLSGSNGGNSTFGILIAVGGGGGAGINVENGLNGGSGGGAGANCNGQTSGGLGVSGQGHNGGNNVGCTPDYAGGGGGGAGTAGQNYITSNQAGNGGNGTAYSISGNTVYYAGGGGGAAYSSGYGQGGLGGGGDANNVANNGSVNSGGGGGGTKNGGISGNGGSGIVIVRYLTNSTSSSLWIKPTSTNTWEFIAYNGSDYFKNGVVGTPTFYPLLGYTVGMNATGSYFNGSIDEVAIWNRSLSASEVLNIYKRGALRLNLSVQSCNDAACLGESFTNLGANLTSPQNLNVANNSYFQYKLDFSTDNVSYTPELYNFTINYDALDVTPPSVTLNYPYSGANLSLTNINFNFTSTDETSTSLNCSLYVDSIYRNNNESVINGTATLLNASVLTEGSHNWTINCSDASKNYNVSTRSFLVDVTLPSGNLTSPSNGTYANASSQNFTANVSDNLGIVNTTLNIYNSTNDLVNQTTTSLGGGVVNTVVGTVVSLVDGIYKWFYGIIDSAGNVYNIKNNTLTIDTTKPFIDYGTGTAVGGANLSQTFIYVNVSVTETNDANITFALYNTTALVNSSLFTNSQRTINWTSLIDGNYSYNVTIIDLAGNRNITATRRIILDTTPPTISNIVFSPNGGDDVDPYKNITFNVSVSESVFSVSNVILQYYNGTTWNNKSMSLLTGSIYTANITLVGSERNYTYNVLANDSLGNSNSSTNQTFNSTWDCTWGVSPSSLEEVVGFYEDRFVGNVTLINTGDIAYSNNNCTISFAIGYTGFSQNYAILTSDSNNWASATNRYFQYTSPITVTASSNQTFSINASFPSVTSPFTETPSITITSSINDSITRNKTASVLSTLITAPPNPLLYQEIAEYPTTYVYLTLSNFSLKAYVRNLGYATSNPINTTAHNVSFNWTLPSAISIRILEGNETNFYELLNRSSRQYNNLTIGLTSSNLASMPKGIFNFTIYSYGYKNNSGNFSLINNSGGYTILNETVAIQFLCYDTLDGVCVSACGVGVDPDCSVPSTAPASSSGSGGGGGGSGVTQAVAVATSAEFQLVRGEQNEVKVIFENKDNNESLKDLTFSVSGKIAKYIDINPKTLSDLGPKSQVTIVLSITSPTYIELGKQELVVTLKGKKGSSDYTDSKKITLEIHELSIGKANQMLNESRDLIRQLDEANISSDYLNELLNKSETGINNFNLEVVRDNYNIINTQVKYALDSKKIISELDFLINSAEEKGIDVSESTRLLKLAKLSIERKEFEQAYKRVKDSQLTYALEVKGEFGKLSYYLKEYPKEISFGAFFLVVFSFGTFHLNKLRRIKKRIKELKEEEKILNELIRVVQNECFKEKKMSMGEYETVIKEYNSKLSKIIEEMIELETKRAQMLRFTSKTKRLKLEKEKIVDLIKELQYDYMKNKKVETRTFELKMESFNKRLAEIEEKFATLEAKKVVKGLGISLKIPKE